MASPHQVAVAALAALVAGVVWVTNARGWRRPRVENLAYPPWFEPALAVFVTLTGLFLAHATTGWGSALLCITTLLLLVVPATNNMLALLRLWRSDPWRRVQTLSAPPPRRWPNLSVIVASCNEPFEVCKLTFDSVADCDYPGQIEIVWVDNTKDTASPALAQLRDYIQHRNTTSPRAAFSAKFIHNTRPGGFKPGNLDLALEHAQSDFLLYLDVDSTVPRRGDGIKQAIADMQADPELGYVQFWSIAVNGGDESNRITSANAAFMLQLRTFEVLRGHGGFPMFLGHNGLWRRETVVACGPWLQHFRGQVMVTEDFLQAFRAHHSGFYGKAMFWPMGEWAPNTLRSTETMWRRWTYGSLQVLEKHSAELLSPSTALTPRERFDVYALVGSYLHPTLTTVGSLACLFDWTSGANTPISGAFLSMSLTYWALQSLFAVLFYHRHWLSAEPAPSPLGSARRCVLLLLVSEIIEMSKSGAILSYALRRPQGWRPTGKGREAGMGLRQLLLHNSGMLVQSAIRIAVTLEAPCGLPFRILLGLWALLPFGALLAFAGDGKDDDGAAQGHIDEIGWRFGVQHEVEPDAAVAGLHARTRLGFGVEP